MKHLSRSYVRFFAWLLLLLVSGCAPQPDLAPDPMTVTAPATTTTQPRAATLKPSTATPQASSTSAPTAPPATASATSSPSPILPTTGPIATAEISFELVHQAEGAVNAVATTEDLVFAGRGPRLLVLDILRPEAPLIWPLGSSDVLAGIVQAVLIRDQIAYVAAGSTLYLLDVAAPNQIGETSHITLPGDISRLLLKDNFLFVGLKMPAPDYGYEGGTLTVVDISNPQEPHLLHNIEVAQEISSIALAGHTLYLGSSSYPSAYSVDVSAPTTPGPPRSLSFSDQPISSMAAAGSTLFTGHPFQMKAWDIGDPLQPELLWESEPVAGVVNDMVFQEQRVLFGTSYADAGIYTSNVATLPLPVTLSPAPTSSTSSSAALQGNQFLLADGNLTVYSTDGDLAPARSYSTRPVAGVAFIDNFSGLFVDGSSRSAESGSHLYTFTLPKPGPQGEYTDRAACDQCRSALLNVTVVDGIAYAGAWDDGLRALDVSYPEEPALLATLDQGADDRFALRDSLAFAGGRGYGVGYDNNGNTLLVFDLSDPTQPQLLTSLAIEGSSTAVDALAEVIVVGSQRNDRAILQRIHTEGNEYWAGEALQLPGAYVADLKIAGDMILVGTNAGLSLVSADSLQLLSSIPTDAVQAVALLDGSLGLISAGRLGSPGMLYALDLTEPGQPQLVGQTPLPSGANALAAQDNIVLVGSEQVGLMVWKINR